MKSCVWDIFDMPSATTGSITDIFVHYVDITLSDIKAQEKLSMMPMTGGRNKMSNSTLY